MTFGRRRIAILMTAALCSLYTMTWLPGTRAVFVDVQEAIGQISSGTWATGPDLPAECAGMTFGETILGTAGNDVIAAGNGGALIFGLGGDDAIAGGNGKDCLVGGDGADVLRGGNGEDVLIGGDSQDTIDGDNGPDRLFGGPGDDTVSGGGGPDHIDGGDGTDSCDGGSGPNVILRCEPGSEAGPEAETDVDADAPGEEGREPSLPGSIDTSDPSSEFGRGTEIDRAKLLEPCPAAADCVVYVVRAGDNLVSIVRFFDVSLRDAMDLNAWLGIAPHLPIGVELLLPWPEWLPGRPGDPVPGDPTPGDPTPVPTPGVPGPDPTPDPTPGDPTPVPTPDRTPDPTPDPTPDRTPDPTPDPTPEPTPDPTPEPEPTPDPTPEPDPTPDATP